MERKEGSQEGIGRQSEESEEVGESPWARGRRGVSGGWLSITCNELAFRCGSRWCLNCACCSGLVAGHMRPISLSKTACRPSVWLPAARFRRRGRRGRAATESSEHGPSPHPHAPGWTAALPNGSRLSSRRQRARAGLGRPSVWAAAIVGGDEMQHTHTGEQTTRVKSSPATWESRGSQTDLLKLTSLPLRTHTATTNKSSQAEPIEQLQFAPTSSPHEEIHRNP